MNAHSLKVLEFDRFLELLGRHAASESGRACILAMRPARDPRETAASGQLYGEALGLRRQHIDLPAARFSPIDAVLASALPEGSILDAEGILAVRALLEVTAGLRSFLAQDRCQGSPALLALAAALETCPELRTAIERVFEPPNGGVRDEASVHLRETRHRMAALERHIRARLEALMRAEALADVLQEDFVTTRHGRYVVPVRREQRGRLKGIIHDQSNSGGTLFVEPEALVEAGNELELLHLEERAELRRILAGLTAQIRAQVATLSRNAEQLCRYDVAFAVSAWALAFDCRFAPAGPCVRLVGARHPLLQAQLMQADRLDTLVPLDFIEPDDANVIVITGSNTGGKTVALKTIGLLTLAAQCGLPLPVAEGSTVRTFDDVYADIGDEQSIEQSLSTFGAHLEHTVAMLQAARNARMLLLFDELGAGTDPLEGGALACAILDALSRTSGLIVATTHLGAAKRFVHDHPRMENASMLFDVETLRPQHRLMMGRAGASYALTIAERFGLPADIVAAARALLSEGDARTESLLHALDETQVRMEREMRDLARVRDEAVRARDAARRDYERVSLELESVRSQKKQVLREAQHEAASLVDGTRREVDRILSQARQGPDREQARGLRLRLDQQSQALTTALEATRATPLRPFGKDELKPGDRVWVEFFKDHGTVVSLADDGRRAAVEIGRVRFDLAREDLGRPRPTAGQASRTVPAEPRAREAKREAVPAELNLVGQRVEDALGQLDRYLDAAILAGLPCVRIVHGYGSGALRKAVHERLARTGVRQFRLGERERDAGGAGVTIVTL